MSQEPKKVLGKILLEQQAVRQQDLERVAAQGQPGGPPLASRLIEAGVVSELDALKALSTQRGVPGIDLHQICIKLVDLATIPREIALVHKPCPSSIGPIASSSRWRTPRTRRSSRRSSSSPASGSSRTSRSSRRCSGPSGRRTTPAIGAMATTSGRPAPRRCCARLGSTPRPSVDRTRLRRCLPRRPCPHPLGSSRRRRSVPLSHRALRRRSRSRRCRGSTFSRRRPLPGERRRSARGRRSAPRLPTPRTASALEPRDARDEGRGRRREDGQGLERRDQRG
ncbi:MAG: hypothetical protein IPG04_15560 [Polyangiaceae bacterium]|nr:hypothetical protein [Polyangiaceae bacterium]